MLRRSPTVEATSAQARICGSRPTAVASPARSDGARPASASSVQNTSAALKKMPMKAHTK